MLNFVTIMAERPSWMSLDYQALVLTQNILYNLSEDVDPLHRILDRELGLQGFWLDDSDPEGDLCKLYDLENLPTEPQGLLKAALILQALLKYKYDLCKTQRREHSKDQCQWGYNFGSTVKLTYNKTQSAEAVGLISSVLLGMVDLPSAGSAAWEMRRFIRRATVEQTIEFGKLVLEMVKEHQDKLEGGLFLNMDDLFWSGPTAVPAELLHLKRKLHYYQTGEYLT